MKYIDAQCSRALPLGRLGENDYTVVEFDVSGWLDEYPDAVIGLYNQRPGEAEAYPVASLEVAGGAARWRITSAELTHAGRGRCELVAVEGETVAKSEVYETLVFDALDGSGVAPAPWEDWQQVFVSLTGDAERAAQDAQDAASDAAGSAGTAEARADEIKALRASAETLPAGSGATAGYDPETGVLTVGVPEGTPGEDGISPTITVTDIPGGHRVTITDATGSHSFDVMDGDSADAPVQDVQVNGVSVLQNGVANVPMATPAIPGVVMAGTVSVIGSTPSIVALSGIRYVCGEVSTLDITLPASGIVDVVFESGSTPTVLTITPPTGQTVRWANGFDPNALEANTTYEINIADGLGVAGSWT